MMNASNKFRNPNPYQMFRHNNIASIIPAVLSGLAGGAALLSFLGEPGIIAGALAGGIIVGFTEAGKKNKHLSASSSKKKPYSESTKRNVHHTH